MPRPELLYEQHPGYIRLRILNLFQLSVAQIQALERFAAERRGRFDFNSHAITVEKRLEPEQLHRLFAALEMDVSMRETQQPPDAPRCDLDARIDFGKYKGMPFCEIPDDYLRWLKTNYYGSQRAELDNELLRRSL